jgi:hypothetical protein
VCVSTGGNCSSERRDVLIKHESAPPVSEKGHTLMCGDRQEPQRKTRPDLNCCKIAIALTTGSMSVIACSIRGDVKNIFLPPPEARIWFAASSPCQLCETLGSGAVPRGPGCLVCSISAVPSWSRRRHSVSETCKPCGCTVSTMVLSATRGLLLFRVVRGGIGFTQ